MFMTDFSGGLSWSQAIAKHTDIECILKCLDEGYIPDLYAVAVNNGRAKDCVQLKGVSLRTIEVEGEREYIIVAGPTPQPECSGFMCISLKNTPAEGYEPMAGGKWYVLASEITQQWAPAK